MEVLMEESREKTRPLCTWAENPAKTSNGIVKPWCV